MSNYEVAVMQGRCIPDENGLIQSFPRVGWKSEFPILNELGIKNLEWTIDFTGIDLNPLLDQKFDKQISELCHEYGVAINTVTADNLMQAPLHKKANGNKTPIQNILDFLIRLEEKNIKIVVWPLVDQGNLCGKDEFNNFCSLFMPIKQFLSTASIMIAFETDLSPKNNQTLIEKLASGNVGINLDIGNSASYGNSISEEFRLNGGEIIHCHIKDRIRGGGTVPLGEGGVDWPQIKNELEKYEGYLITLQTARTGIGQEVKDLQNYLSFLHQNSIISI